MRQMIPAAAMAVAAVSLVGSASTAFGATSAGDPQTSGCAATAITGRSVQVNNAGVNLGHADLRYSTTCQTEWVTFYPNPNSWVAVHATWAEPSVWIQNQAGTNLYTASSSGNMEGAYTEMLPSMKYRTGCGGVQLYNGRESTYGSSREGYIGWYYIGCY